jgi:glutamyl-tRNA reductase
MKLVAVGCSFRTTPVEFRERLSFGENVLDRALGEVSARYGLEAVILSTCNRVELFLAHSAAGPELDVGVISEFLGEFHGIPVSDLAPHLYQFRDGDAVRHLFRVIASLDSQIVGEGQIARQVRAAYQRAQKNATVGPSLHALFQHSFRLAGRVRSETGIARGHVSVSSVAVDFVRQVFDHFGDKSVLVIGAGKMGELTLRHLRALQVRQILVTNRSVEKASELAGQCGGVALPWERLDDALTQADIILSTTGASEPIVTRERYAAIRARRSGRPVVILDIAVPRDFDPRIHDGDRTCIFNIDDLQKIREQTLRERQSHLPAAEAIVQHETQRFLSDWRRRRHGGAIARLTEDFEAKRNAVVTQLLSRLDGRLSEEDRAYIEGAFRLLQNQFLHGPITALTEESHEGAVHTLLDALRRLFRFEE